MAIPRNLTAMTRIFSALSQVLALAAIALSAPATVVSALDEYIIAPTGFNMSALGFVKVCPALKLLSVQVSNPTAPDVGVQTVTMYGLAVRLLEIYD